MVVPAHDEGAFIGGVVAPLVAAKNQGFVDEVVVVDDGSSDGTAKIAGDFGAHVLSMGVNRGKALAVLRGIVYADEVGATIVATSDADMGNLTPDSVSSLVSPLRGNPEVQMVRASYVQKGPLLGGYTVFECPLERSGFRAIRMSALEPLLRGNTAWLQYLSAGSFGLEVMFEERIAPLPPTLLRIKAGYLGELRPVDATAALRGLGLVSRDSEAVSVSFDRADEERCAVESSDGGRFVFVRRKKSDVMDVFSPSERDGSVKASLKLAHVDVIDFSTFLWWEEWAEKSLVEQRERRIIGIDDLGLVSRPPGGGSTSMDKINDDVARAEDVKKWRTEQARELRKSRSTLSLSALEVSKQAAASFPRADEVETLRRELEEMTRGRVRQRKAST
ncbi:UDP-N-acetylglucosamine--dolichyl-phosphate N-acetylglucosaminyltransferase [uncultured archaeon]|nr:UDP-N-acetylglucosamine--dolichyl-phosphate N-acetylglucosaminyltransferase [uncultured archaeon]